MSHRQYYQTCQFEGLAEEDYVGIPYPHPYLTIWLECKRYPTPTGVPALPEPERGPLDQDADIMCAFDILEEAQSQRVHEEEIRKQARTAARQIDGLGFLNPDF